MNTVIRGRHGYREKLIHEPLPETHWAPPVERKPSRLWDCLKYVGVFLLMVAAAYMWFHGPGRKLIDRANDAQLEQRE